MKILFGTALVSKALVTGHMRRKPGGIGVVVVGPYVTRSAAAAGRASSAGRKGPPLLFAVPSWHGAAAQFEAFRDDKIGSGEGNQSFGYGHYFAGARGTAEYYREQVAATKGAPTRAAHVYLAEQLEDMPEALLADLRIGISRALAEHPDQQVPAAMIVKHVYWRSPEVRRVIDEQRNRIEHAVAGALDKALAARGVTYRVRLNLVPEELIDWEKPLAGQSRQVRAALASLGIDGAVRTRWVEEPMYERVGKTYQPRAGGHLWRLYRNDYPGTPQASIRFDEANKDSQWPYHVYQVNGQYLGGAHTLEGAKAIARNRVLLAREEPMTGATLYRMIEAPDDKTRSAKLLAAGIRGIRYLDQISRASAREEQTHNYVLFDPDLAEILEAIPAGVISAGTPAAA